MKVLFIQHQHGKAPQWTYGIGGVGVLLKLLLDSHETSNSNHNFYFIQETIQDKVKMIELSQMYKKTKYIFVKFNKFINMLQRGIHKIARLIGWKLFKLKNANYHLSNNYRKPFTNYSSAVYKEAVKINPDLIIFEDYIDPLVKKIAKKFGKNRIYIHGHINPELLDVSRMNSVGGIIAVSDFILNRFLSYGDFDYKKYVLKNCIDDRAFSKSISFADREKLRMEFGFNKDDKVIIFCGRITKDKGVLEMINSVLSLPDNVKLLIIGDIKSNKKNDIYINKVKMLIDNNSERIKLTGFLPNMELFKYYQIGDLQIVPSIWEEAAGMVVLEGQMCGLPQIITRSGGMPEYATKKTIIIDKDNNIEQNIKNAIVELLANVDLLESMKKLGIENAKKYTQESYYNNFISIIEDIFEKNNNKKVKDEEL